MTEPSFRSCAIRARLGALVVASLLAANAVHAEPRRIPAPTGDPSPTAIEEARARFSAGNRAVQSGRWADALGDFERAYALSGVPAALFNVATTLRALGRHVEARDAFDQLLASHPKQDPAERERARTLREEEQARIVRLGLEGLPAAGLATIAVDGQRVSDDGTRPLVIELDPGPHELRIERPQYKPFTWKGELADGARQVFVVKLVVEPAAFMVPPPPAPEKSSGGVLRSPIFWSVVGAVVLGAGAAGTWWGLKGRDQRLAPGSPNVVHL